MESNIVKLLCVLAGCGADGTSRAAGGAEETRGRL